jgi:iron complex outermembrane receptor protein
LSAIKGQVLTSDGHPAAYVSVQIKNTNQGTVTDENGEFIFKKIKPGHYILQASLVGHEIVDQEVEVETDKITHVSIQLASSYQQMKEVVVVSGANKYKVNNASPSLRIQTPLTEVPQNIQVVTKDVLNDQQAFTMGEGVTRNISGAQRVAHWNMYARINVRGAKLTPFRNGMNVQINEYSPLTEDMSMVERIEFVKGPAGFMLSNGEPSGFYNVVTKKPTGNTQKELTFSLGSFENYRATADIDGKLTKDGKLLYRVNVMGQQANSHRDFEFNNRYSIVPVLKYLIDDKTTVTLEYTHQYLETNAIGGNIAFSKRGYADVPRNFTTVEPNFTPTKINDKSLQVIFEHQINTQWKLTAQGAYFNYNQVGQSMWPVGFTTPGNDSLLQRAINNWDALGINKTGQFFVNGKVKTGRINHVLLGGIDMKFSNYYADWNQWSMLGNANFNIYKPTYGNITLPQYDRSKDIRERAVQYNYGYNAFYIQDELGFLNNTLRLTLAGRYTTNIYKNPEADTYTDHKFTPRAGLSYSIDKNTALYFVYDQAFLQNTGKNWQGKNFKPLTGTNIEAGIKKDWFNGRWNSVLSVYQITKNNVLVTDMEHPHPTNGYIYSKENGQQQIKGIELDIRGDLVENLGVVINYAYTDGKITKDIDPAVKNNKVPGTSKHIQNTWLSYRVSKGVLNGLRISMGYQYQAGRLSGMVYDKSENKLPDYFSMDGGIGYTINKLSLNLNVNNILDKYLYSGTPVGAGADRYYFWESEPGRNLRLTVGYRF